MIFRGFYFRFKLRHFILILLNRYLRFLFLYLSSFLKHILLIMTKLPMVRICSLKTKSWISSLLTIFFPSFCIASFLLPWFSLWTFNMIGRFSPHSIFRNTDFIFSRTYVDLKVRCKAPYLGWGDRSTPVLSVAADLYRFTLYIKWLLTIIICRSINIS